MEIKIEHSSNAKVIHKIMSKAYAEYINDPAPSSALSETVSSINNALLDGQKALIGSIAGQPIACVRYLINGFYYICWGLKTIHVVTFRNNECFPPTSAALFLSTLGGKKGLLHTCFSAGVLVISFNVDLCEKRQKKAQFHQFLYT
ncbi:hypothetical protein [Kurthia zopfii]|uniref:hypothetical protein n=1 Tax=Kurthia zopfii TaxID=1650 RepID=UPI000F83101D|nr:hypothetical protein [Kurthia zopfii]